jgi:hypothetical protein
VIPIIDMSKTLLVKKRRNKNKDNLLISLSFLVDAYV